MDKNSSRCKGEKRTARKAARRAICEKLKQQMRDAKGRWDLPFNEIHESIIEHGFTKAELEEYGITGLLTSRIMSGRMAWRIIDMATRARKA